MDAVPFHTADPAHRLRRGLLREITAMLDATDKHEVLGAAMAAVPGVGPFAPEAAYVVRDGRVRRCGALGRGDPSAPADLSRVRPGPANRVPADATATDAGPEDPTSGEATNLADPGPGVGSAGLIPANPTETDAGPEDPTSGVPADRADPGPGAAAAGLIPANPTRSEDPTSGELADLADLGPGAGAADLTSGGAADRLDKQVRALDGRSRRLDDLELGGPSLRAIALRHRDTCLGYLVIRELAAPSPEETADADLLAQQAGAALAALTLRPGEPARTGEENGLSREVAAPVTQPVETVWTEEPQEAGRPTPAAPVARDEQAPHLLQPGHTVSTPDPRETAHPAQPTPAEPARETVSTPDSASHDIAGPARPADPSGAALTDLVAQNAFHGALARAAASGKGERAILQALHDHTGFPVLTEDRFGNLRARAGRGGPEIRPPDGRRTDLLAGARRGPGAVRDRDRLIVPVEMAGDLLGLVALVDPDLRATRADADALERTALVLTPELSHERELAALEPRLRHNLVEKLISAEATDDVIVHAATLGHDLRRPHRVAVLRWPEAVEGAALGDAVERAATRLRLDALVGARGSTTVALVADPEPDLGEALYRAVSDGLADVAGAVGTGGRCDVCTDLPHSYDEAVRALTVRRRSQDPYGSTGFEELGLCRMMGTGDGEREADRFVREWLGPLLDYDAQHHTDLTATLSRYLESGGSYDATAEALLIHRSTVRYRLQRIREITGHDLGAVETRLNLHVATRIRNVLDTPR